MHFHCTLLRNANYGNHNTHSRHKDKWNESGFRPPLCTYRLNWARRTSWGWWDDWDNTVLQTQDSKFDPGGLRPSTLPLGHGGSPQYWLSHVDGEETFFVSFKPPRLGTEPRAQGPHPPKDKDPWRLSQLTRSLLKCCCNVANVESGVSWLYQMLWNEINGVLHHISTHIG